MKIIGRRTEGLDVFIATITENSNGFFDIEVYQEFSDGSRNNNMIGLWATTVGSAKKRINLETGIKSKDWEWKTV